MTSSAPLSWYSSLSKSMGTAKAGPAKEKAAATAAARPVKRDGMREFLEVLVLAFDVFYEHVLLAQSSDSAPNGLPPMHRG